MSDETRLIPEILIEIVESCSADQGQAPDNKEEILNWLHKRLREEPYRRFAKSEIDRLSSREKEVLKLAGMGLSSDEIANELNVAKRTVDTFRHNIFQKLRLDSKGDFFKIAFYSEFDA